ncbi:MAG: ComEC/Rec2 family competence protein, partial [Flavobacteriaceae bacterium]
NYQNYMQNLGVYHKINLTNVPFLSHSSDERTLIGLAARTRGKIIADLKKLGFGKTERSIIQALLLGDRREIDQATFKSYKNAGAIHILAISGLHVGIVLLMLQILLKPLESLPGGRTIKLLIIVLLLWAFALIAGFSASVVRAVTMFSFVAYALFLHRPGSSFNILALSMLFILLFIDPLFLFQLGFQLSYAAVFSILWFYPKLVRFWMPNHFLPRKAWQLFSVGLAAQLGVLPLSLYYFHQFPGLFFISNMVIVPFLGIILGLGFVIVIMAVFTIIPDFLIFLYDSIIRMMNTTIDWIAHQEAFLFTNIYFDKGHLLLTGILIICIIYTTEKLKPARIIAVLVCFVALQLWSLSAFVLSRSKVEAGLLHSVGETVLFYRQGTHINVLTDHPEEAKKLLSRYMVSENIGSVSFDSLRNIYRLNEKKLMIIDSPDVLVFPHSKPGIVLLTDSPAINLDRYLSKIKPEFVIADGSNYKSYVKRWKRSCHKLGIPFHDTNIDGAIYLD